MGLERVWTAWKASECHYGVVFERVRKRDWLLQQFGEDQPLNEPRTTSPHVKQGAEFD